MNSADYFAGFAASSVTVVPWLFAAPRVIRRLLPEWDGAAAALAAAIVGVSGVLVVAELLGMVAGLARWPMAVVSAAVAIVASVIAGGRPPIEAGPAEAAPSPGYKPAALVLAAFCVLGVSAALLGRDARTLHTGPSDTDSLHYHLTQSAYFAQSHDIDHLHQVGSSDPSVYYPFDAELLDAVAMLGPRPDLGVLTLNVGFGWLALLACWVMGARWTMAPPALAGGAAVLALPLLAGASSGPGLNDLPSLAMLLSAIAVLAHAESRPRRWLTACGVAGLALGIAGGSKLSLLAPVVAVALAVVVVAPARRVASAAVITATALLTGGFWYLRDWVSVGSPVPSVNLTVAGHGLHAVPYPETKPYAFAVSHYLTNGPVIRHWFIPELKVIFTPGWPVIVALGVVGVALGLLQPGDRLRRMLSLTVLFGFAVYVVTPTTALGSPNQPVLFGANVRYAISSIALSIMLAASAAPLRRYVTLVTAAFTALTFTLLASSTLDRYIDRAAGWAAAALIGAAFAWAIVVFRRWPSRWLVAALAVGSLVVVGAAGAVVQHHYVRERYAAADPVDRLFGWAGTVHGQRIGVVGFPLIYPFFGPTFDNHVAYVGVSAPDRSFAAPTSCRGWRAALAAGRYDDVVVEPLLLEHTPRLLRWTTALPGARVVLRDRKGAIVSLPRVISASGCPE